MDDREALAELAEQVRELARTDQETEHVRHDAGLLVTYWQTLTVGGIPEDLVGELLVNWQSYVLGVSVDRPQGSEEEDE